MACVLCFTCRCGVVTTAAAFLLPFAGFFLLWWSGAVCALHGVLWAPVRLCVRFRGVRWARWTNTPERAMPHHRATIPPGVSTRPSTHTHMPSIRKKDKPSSKDAFMLQSFLPLAWYSGWAGWCRGLLSSQKPGPCLPVFAVLPVLPGFPRCGSGRG